MSKLKTALTWLREWSNAPIDRRAILAACWSTGLVITGELIAFWWRHAREHLIGVVMVPTCWCAAYIGASMRAKQFQDRRHRRRRARLLEPRRGFPPGVQVVEEIYSALRNLGYHEREVRQALYNLRARDLTDFDTGFKAAMAHLQSPQRAV